MGSRSADACPSCRRRLKRRWYEVGPFTTALGRKRPFKIDQIQSSERPLSGKADIKLNLGNRSANDPKRTLPLCAGRNDLQHFGKITS